MKKTQQPDIKVHTFKVTFKRDIHGPYEFGVGIGNLEAGEVFHIMDKDKKIVNAEDIWNWYIVHNAGLLLLNLSAND